MYGECDAHPSGYGQGNGGFSGTPMWKVQQQNQYKEMVKAAQQAHLEEQDALKAEQLKLDAARDKGQRLIVDAVVLPGSSGQKLVRHVIVKDLRKVSGTLNIQLPTQGVFEGTGQRALFALFDSQAAEMPDPKVAEACCRLLPVTLLRNLATLQAHNCIPAFVKATLLKTFEDLERDLEGNGSGIGEQCSASLVLLVGNWLFSAVLGCSGATFFKACAEEPQGGGSGGTATVRRPPSSGSSVASGFSYVPMHLGSGAHASPGFASAGKHSDPTSRSSSRVPEVVGLQLSECGLEPFIVLAGLPVAGALNVQEIMEIGNEFLHRPRATSGKLVAKAAERLSAKNGGASAKVVPDCAVVAAFLREPEEVGGVVGSAPSSGRRPEAPLVKRGRTEAPGVMESVRLRHIVVRHKDCKFPVDPLKNKPATRSQAESEEILRATLAELLKDGHHRGDTKWAANTTPRMLAAIRNNSECKSSLKGGSQCGDLGWLGKKDLERMGKDFYESVRLLGIGEWSDVLHSEQGAHLVIRIA